MMLQLFSRQLCCEFIIQVRQLRSAVNASVFFLMVMIFFPLTMPADLVLLRNFLPGLVWIAVLLAILLASEQLFQQDEYDGVTEQWLVSGHPISLLVLAKIVVHWMFMMIPIVLFCPILAILFSLTLHEMNVLIASLILGTPAMQFLCALAAVFGIGLRQNGVLMALVLLPLTIPVLIFGSSAMTTAMQGLPVIGYFAILLALSITAVTFLPFAIAGVVRAGSN